MYPKTASPIAWTCCSLFVCVHLLCTATFASAPLAFEPFNESELSSQKFAFAPPPGYLVGEVRIGDAPINSDITDGHGLLISLDPGEGILVIGNTRHAVGTDPLLVRVSVWCSGPGASVAAAALNVTGDDRLDGRMSYMVREAAGVPAGLAVPLALVCQISSGVMVPAFQAVLSPEAQGAVDVLFDNFQVLPARIPDLVDLIALDPPGDFEGPSEGLLTGINGVPGQAEIVAVDSGHALQLSATPEGGSANAGLLASAPTTDLAGWLFLQTEIVASGEEPSHIYLVLTNGNQTLGTVGDPAELVGGLLRAGGLFEEISPFLLAAVQHTPSTALPGGGGRVVIDDLLVYRHEGDLVPEPTPPPTGSVAAMLVAPERLRVGNRASVAVTTVSAREHIPQSVPVRISLTKPDGMSVPLFNGSTGDDGHLDASFKVPHVGAGTYKLGLAVQGMEPLSASVAVEEGPVLFIETDKPIYRPGQTIHGRVLALSNTLTPLESPVEVSITDAKGIKIYKESLATNSFGVAQFSLPLANELNLGTWTIKAKSGQTETVLNVEVDKYVLPKFKVDLKPEREWFLRDETITGRVEAEYFFGKPVNGTVDLAASKYVGVWDTYATFSGELVDGKVEFTLPPVGYAAGTPGAEGAGTVQLDLVVTDESGHEERTTALLKIVNAPVQVQLIAESATLKPGIPIQILVITQTPDGLPVDADVVLYATFWDKNMGVLSSIQQTISTRNGIFLADLSVPARTMAGQVTAEVKHEGKVDSQTITLNAVYSPSASFIHLRQERPEIYGVGDRASFIVTATHPGTVFYDVYASGRTVFSGATSERLMRFIVTPEMSPKAKVVAYLINPNGEVSADVLPFDVEMASTETLSAEFSAEEILPGDPVTLRLQASGEAMVGVSIVDESVYALSEGRLNLQQVFAELERIFMEPQAEAHPEPGWVGVPTVGSQGTVDILKSTGLQIVASKEFVLPKGEPMDPRRFWLGPNVRGEGPMPIPAVGVDEALPEAGAAKEAALAEVQRVRQFFPETWVWRPDLLTDSAGLATLDLTAPDSITTWRLHAVSTSDRGLGIAGAQLRVFQDFFVEPDMPYAVTRGEEFPLRLQVFNYVDSPQEVRLELKAADFFEALADLVHTVTVQPSSVSSVSIPIRPTRVGLWTLEVVAQSATRADAIRKEFRVEPEGTRREITTNGILHEGETVSLDGHFPAFEPLPGPVDETVPPDSDNRLGIVPDSGYMRLAITPSLVGQSMHGLEDLLGMPYGCGEQNMIFLAPDIEVLRYLSFTGQLNPETRAKAEHFVNVGYQRELTYRRNDGSFSAFGESDSSGSLWLTAFVLSTFSVARDVRTIDEVVLADAAKWIEDHQLADGSWEPVGFIHHKEMIGGVNSNYGLTAFVLIALANYGEGSGSIREKAASYLEDKLSDATDNAYTLAIAAYALARVNSPSADQAVDLLLTLAETDANGLFWRPNAVETTSYAALALMELGRPEAVQALSWIASQRNSLGGFGSTQDTVMAFRALAAAAIRQSRDVDARIEVYLDGDLLHTFTVNSENFDLLQIVEIPQEGDLEIRHVGKGDVTYQLAKIFNVWPTDENLVTNGMELKVEYSAEHVAVDDLVDVTVSVTYLGIEPVPVEPVEPGQDGRGAPIGQVVPDEEVLPPEPPPAPDTEEGKPALPPPSSGMIVLDISVPTGFAAVQETLDAVLAMEKVKRIEQAGRKVIFYLDGLEVGETLEFMFQVKALFPVKAIVGTSAAYSYYQPDIRAEASGPNIVVE